MKTNASPDPEQLLGMARAGDSSALGQLLELYRSYFIQGRRLGLRHLRTLKLTRQQNVHSQDARILGEDPLGCRHELVLVHEARFAGRVNPYHDRAVELGRTQEHRWRREWHCT